MSKVKKKKELSLQFDHSIFAADILAKRQKDDLSLVSVSKITGVIKSGVYFYEAGKMCPSADNLAKMVNWLGTPIQKYFILK